MADIAPLAPLVTYPIFSENRPTPKELRTIGFQAWNARDGFGKLWFEISLEKRFYFRADYCGLVNGTIMWREYF